MKLFLRRLLLFVTLLIIATAILLGTIIQQVNKKECFVLKPGPVKTIFLGYSHVEYGINDSLIADARNLGSAAEPYFYTWKKAQRIFESNPEIELVFIEFSNKNVNAYMDSAIYGDYYIPRFLPQYATVLDAADYRQLLRLNAPKVISSLFLVPRESLLAFRERKKDVIKAKKWGGYMYETQSTVAAKLEKYKNGYPQPFLDNEKATYNLIYLHKLLALCRENGKQVWFFSAPLHTQSGDRNNDSVFKEVRETSFGDIPYLDMRNLYFPDEEYRDLEHLNGKGARRFSLFLQELLQDSALYHGGNHQELINRTWLPFQPAR